MILFVEIAFFTSIAVLVGRFGIEQLAAHEVAIQLVAVTFMFPFAIAQAAAVRVARRIGAVAHAQARTAAACALFMLARVMRLLRTLCRSAPASRPFPGLSEE